MTSTKPVQSFNCTIIDHLKRLILDTACDQEDAQ